MFLPANSLGSRQNEGPRPLRERTTEELEREITTLHSRISAETCEWLLLVAEYDRREAYRKEWGARHMADWLSWHCGVGVRAAHEQVRVARSLAGLPLTTELFRRGELSYSKVRAISRAADDENEETLVHMARNSTAAQTERIVSAYRRAKAVGDEDAQQSRRFASWQREEDGSISLRARLSPDEGAIMIKALDRAHDEILKERNRECDAQEHGRKGQPRLADVTNTDALVRVAENALSGSQPRTGGDSTQVVVHVDVETLDARALAPEGGGYASRSELEGGNGIPVEVAQRLACDASLVTIVERGGEPISVGRKTRSVPPATRRALRARDGNGCRFPGCTADRYVEAHHVVHWAHGGGTDLENLVSLCRHHHRLLHEGGFSVVALAHGQFEFVRKNGSRFPAVPPLPGWTAPADPEPFEVPAWVRPKHGVIGPCAPMDGRQKLHLDLVLDALSPIQIQRGTEGERRERNPVCLE